MLLYKKFKENKLYFIISDIIFFVVAVIIEITLEALGYNFEIVGSFIFTVLLIKFIYNENLIDAFYYCICTTAFIEVCKLLMMSPCFILLKLGFKIDNLIINFEDTVSTFLIIIVLIKLTPLKLYYYKLKKILEKVNFLAINLIVFVILMRLVAFYEYSFFKKYFFALIVIFIIFIAISILFARYSAKIKEQEIQISTYSTYNPIILELTEDIKSRQHDFKNHINTIYGIIQTSEEKELKNQLENYITTLNDSLKPSDEIITINNKLIAAIIYIKSNYAKSENINFHYEVDCDLKGIKLKDYEISEILNNLIDNSFSAVMDEEIGQRKVELKLSSDERCFYIYIENGGLKVKASQINKIFNKGFSTKNEKNHGYGLYNVSKIVKAYNGEIQANINGELVQMALYIPK